MKAIWGVDIELGKSMLEYILSDEDRNKARENFDRALEGEDFSIIEAYGDETLSRKYYEDFYIPLFSTKNEVNGLTVIVNDVTEEKVKEFHLSGSEKRFRTIIEGALEGVLAIRESDNTIAYANPAVCADF